MPYRIKGTLKLPVTSQPAAGVDIEFISRRNYSPLLMDLSSVIKTSPTGAYDVTLEYGEYAVVLYWGCNQPSHVGKLFVFADTVTGLDLQTLLQQSDWQPATPEYIQQIQDWLADAASAAASAKASELAAEADRAEVASNKNIVVSAQADVTSKRNDVTTKAAQVAANTATVNEKTPLAVAAANTATEKAAAASTDAATASDAASRAETAAQAMTGAVLDGGQCNLSSGFYPPALTVGGKKYSTVWYVQVGGTVSGTTYDAGDVLRYTTANNAYFKIDAVDTATAQINAHAAKVGAHPMSGVAGLEAALADKADASSVFEAAPLPDVWIPFNDSLRMITGFGDYDRIYIGEQYLELNSRSANFERATTATYIDKSGVLRTAAINEPRFEKEGLLIEGQSANLFRGDSLRPQSGAVTSKVSSSKYPDIVATKVVGSQETPNIIGASREQIENSTVYSASVIIDLANSNITTGLVRYRFAYSANWQSRYIDVYTDGRVRKLGDGTTGSAKVVGDLLFISMTTTSSDAASTSGGGSVDIVSILEDGAEPPGAPTGYSVCVVGFQLEKLPFASSYIPTKDAAVTRAADKCWLNHRNTVRWGEITCAVQMHTHDTSITTAPDETIASRTVFTMVDRPDCAMYLRNRPEGIYHLEYGSNWQNTTVRIPYVTDNLIAAKVHGGTEATRTRDLFVNGNKASSSAPYTFNPSAELPEIIYIGRSPSGRHLFGHIRNFRVWNGALSDAQIKGLK